MKSTYLPLKGWGEVIWWKILRSKISSDCPCNEYLPRYCCNYNPCTRFTLPLTWCTVVMSMFVSFKWQRVALLMRWRASVRTLFYWYITFLDHRTNISRKVHAPRFISASGASNKFQNCHLDKTNMDKASQLLHNRSKPFRVQYGYKKQRKSNFLKYLFWY